MASTKRVLNGSVEIFPLAPEGVSLLFVMALRGHFCGRRPRDGALPCTPKWKKISG